MNKPEVYDPQRALFEDYRSFCVTNRREKFVLQCEDGDVIMTGARLLLNLIMCMPLITRRVPISKHHLALSGIYDAKVHAEHLEKVCITLERYGYTRDQLGRDVVKTVEDIHNLCYTHLPNFIRTVDIFSIGDTVLQPEVRKVTTIDYGDVTDRNIKRMEGIFKSQSNEVLNLLSGDTLKHNVFRAPLLCGALKSGQFVQFVMSVGPRTDNDEHMFTKPVEGSFLSGMKDITGLVMESRSASKSVHYNITQMRMTQYMNRQIHLQTSIAWNLYPGDCGSDVYMDYFVDKKYLSRYFGKFFLSKEGRLKELTAETADEVVDKILKFREVTTCRHPDGTCEVCAGTISKAFSKNGNIGFIANVNVGAPVAQQVLSAKHLTTTNTAEYEVPGPLSEVLYSNTNEIFLNIKLHRNKNVLAFGFQASDISKINDLKYFLSGKELHAAYFTSIKYMHVGILQKDGSILRKMTRTPMSRDKKTYPHLSSEILRIIREHPEDMIADNGIYWIVLRNIDPTRPIMQCTVVNNSIKKFVGSFRSLVTSEVEGYTSLNDFISDLKNLIWPRVDSHITHIATIAKACLITDRKNYSIPIVTDPNNVTFSSLSRNIPMRSIGGLLAFEGFNRAVKTPTTFIIPKQHGIFDEAMGYTDIIERDKSYPVATGGPILYDL